MESHALRPILAKKNVGHEKVKFWMGAVKLEQNISLDIIKEILGEKIAFLTHSQPKAGLNWTTAFADPEKRYPFICRSSDFSNEALLPLYIHVQTHVKTGRGNVS